MRDYIYWGDVKKSTTFLREIGKISLIGLVAFFIFPLKLIFICGIWGVFL